MRLTEDLLYRQKYEDFLNELGCHHHDHPDNHGRMPYEYIGRYGTWLRLNDPIAFNVGFNEWMQERRELWNLIK